MDIMKQMKRREAIGKMGYSFLGILSAPALISLLQGCRGENGKFVAGHKLLLLEPRHEELVNELANIIIPETDTPGASEAEVGRFIDLMLAECYSEQDRVIFLEGLDRIEDDSIEKYKRPFLENNPEEKINMLKVEAAPENLEKPTRFFQILKELTLLGYFTSEVGATQALAYNPYPGKYLGCTELSEDQKLWSNL